MNDTPKTLRLDNGRVAELCDDCASKIEAAQKAGEAGWQVALCEACDVCLRLAHTGEAVQ